VYGSWILQANHYIGCTLGWQIDARLDGYRQGGLTANSGLNNGREEVVGHSKDRTACHATAHAAHSAIQEWGLEHLVRAMECVSFWSSWLEGLCYTSDVVIMFWVSTGCFGVCMGPSKAPGNPPVQAVSWTVGIIWLGRLPSDYGEFVWWLCFITASRHQRLDWLIDWLIGPLASRV